MTQGNPPVLYLVACGGMAARRLGPFVARLQSQGWQVCVVATPAALKFLDVAALREQTGYVVRHEYKHPDEPDLLPAADAMAVVPATFNTVNKLAAGISDTLALGLLNEAIGRGLPILVVPAPNAALARHPAFGASVAALRSWGVRVLYDPVAYPLPVPNSGPSSADRLPWAAAEELIAGLRPAPGTAGHPDGSGPPAAADGPDGHPVAT